MAGLNSLVSRIALLAIIAVVVLFTITQNLTSVFYNPVLSHSAIEDIAPQELTNRKLLNSDDVISTSTPDYLGTSPKYNDKTIAQQHGKSTPKPHENKNIKKSDCGLILFYHINQCAGGSLGDWFQDHVPKRNYHLLQDIWSYLTVSNVSTLQFSWEQMIPRANNFLKRMSSKSGWRVLEIHHGFPGVYYTQDIIQHWKDIVEANGCLFHKTTMLRDPLDRFVSNVNKNNPPLDHIETFMESRKNWLSRYFLFGLCGYYNHTIGCGFNPKSNFTITPNLNETYVDEAIHLMNSFDSVGFTEKFSEYLSYIKSITGWKDNDKKKAKTVEHSHKSNHTFVPTQEILQKFLDINREDYVLYYTMKHAIKKI